MPTTLPYIPISDCINYAKICQYLISNDRARQKAFGNGFLSTNSPQLIYTVRKSLEWAYGINPNNPLLVSVSNYLYSLIRGYVDTAKVILSQGGSGIIVNPSTGAVSQIISLSIEFVVGTVGSPMVNGQTVLTLNYSNLIKNSEIVNFSGAILQVGLIDTYSYTIAYSPTSAIITFNQPVSNSQVYTIKFLQYASI